MLVQNCTTSSSASVYAQPLTRRQVQHLFGRMMSGASRADMNWAIGKTAAEIVHSILDAAADPNIVPDPDETIMPWGNTNILFDPAVTELVDNHDRSLGTAQNMVIGFRLERMRSFILNGMIGDNLQNASEAELIADRARAVKSKLILFWHGHIPVSRRAVSRMSAIYNYFYILSKNAVGNFKQQIKDVGRCQAMLQYLSGGSNYSVPNNPNHLPNENYARELLELFTMGTTYQGQENYTQQDIEEIARVLTGWRLDHYTPNVVKWDEFVLARTCHDWGSKTFLGQTLTPQVPDGLPNSCSLGGANHTAGIYLSDLAHMSCTQNGGDEALQFANEEYDSLHDIIFTQRQDAIAYHICKKLYKHYVYDEVDDVFIEQLATTFKNNNWEIIPVLKQLFTSQHFFETTFQGAHIKSPAEFNTSFYKQCSMQYGVDFLREYYYLATDKPSNPNDYFFYSDEPYSVINDSTRYLRSTTDVVNQSLFYPPNVAGWPGHQAWISENNFLTRRRNLVFWHLTRVINHGQVQGYESLRTFVRDLAIDIYGANAISNPQQIVEALMAHLIPVDIEQQIMQRAVLALKGNQLPEPYYNGYWNLDLDTDSISRSSITQQVVGLVEYIVSLPEFQMS